MHKEINSTADGGEDEISLTWSWYQASVSVCLTINPPHSDGILDFIDIITHNSLQYRHDWKNKNNLFLNVLNNDLVKRLLNLVGHK